MVEKGDQADIPVLNMKSRDVLDYDGGLSHIRWGVDRRTKITKTINKTQRRSVHMHCTCGCCSLHAGALISAFSRLSHPLISIASSSDLIFNRD